ncbi:hypothetical protein AcV5_008023 [Taiwanofungus camphoratus]|nr:hypothetical protein AcV5_008023 [Antrodia cinnamomea]
MFARADNRGYFCPRGLSHQGLSSECTVHVKIRIQSCQAVSRFVRWTNACLAPPEIGMGVGHGNGYVLFLHIGARYADAIRGSREPDIAVSAPVHVS